MIGESEFNQIESEIARVVATHYASQLKGRMQEFLKLFYSGAVPVAGGLNSYIEAVIAEMDSRPQSLRAELVRNLRRGRS